MAIRLACVCGKVLNLPENLSGEKIRCKECGKVLKVPDASSVVEGAPARVEANNPLAIRGHRRCGRCGKSYPQKDRICTACGIDMDTGANLYVSLEASGDADPSAKPQAEPSRPGFAARFLRLLGIRKGP